MKQHRPRPKNSHKNRRIHRKEGCILNVKYGKIYQIKEINDTYEETRLNTRYRQCRIHTFGTAISKHRLALLRFYFIIEYKIISWCFSRQRLFAPRQVRYYILYYSRQFTNMFLTQRDCVKSGAASTV